MLLWLYVGWRVLRGVRRLVVLIALAGVALVLASSAGRHDVLGHRGAVAGVVTRLRTGVQRHVLAPSERGRHPRRVERSGSR